MENGNGTLPEHRAVLYDPNLTEKDKIRRLRRKLWVKRHTGYYDPKTEATLDKLARSRAPDTPSTQSPTPAPRKRRTNQGRRPRGLFGGNQETQFERMTED